jgi:hypothetical protein
MRKITVNVEIEVENEIAAQLEKAPQLFSNALKDACYEYCQSRSMGNEEFYVEKRYKNETDLYKAKKRVMVRASNALMMALKGGIRSGCVEVQQVTLETTKAIVTEKFLVAACRRIENLKFKQLEEGYVFYDDAAQDIFGEDDLGIDFLSGILNNGDFVLDVEVISHETHVTTMRFTSGDKETVVKQAQEWLRTVLTDGDPKDEDFQFQPERSLGEILELPKYQDMLKAMTDDEIKPKYVHDSWCCHFEGRWTDSEGNDFDLYSCNTGRNKTYIGRASSEGGDYASMLHDYPVIDLDYAPYQAMLANQERQQQEVYDQNHRES